jgi:hypothetical protein
MRYCCPVLVLAPYLVGIAACDGACRAPDPPTNAAIPTGTVAPQPDASSSAAMEPAVATSIERGPGVVCAFGSVVSEPRRCPLGKRCCIFLPDAPDEPSFARCEGGGTDAEAFCPEIDLSCDEASDCAAGEVCCGFGGANPLRTRCLAPEACEGASVCAPGEACLPGQRCGGVWWPHLGPLHRCVAPPRRGLVCGATRCEAGAAEPYCRWDVTTQSGTCTGRSFEPESAGIFECFSAADCALPNQRCCGSSTGSACNGHCTDDFSGERTVCALDVECRPEERCVEVGGGPPGLRFCEARGE